MQEVLVFLTITVIAIILFVTYAYKLLMEFSLNERPNIKNAMLYAATATVSVFIFVVAFTWTLEFKSMIGQ